MEASSAASIASAPWKKSRTAEKCCLDARGTACFPCSRSGMTSPPSTENHGMERWISSLLASRASHGASPASERERQTNGTSGQTPSESFARWDRNGSCWRMSQGFLALMDISDEYLGTWPRAGLMRGGIAYRLRPLEPITRGIDSGSLPTPQARDCTRAESIKRDRLPDIIGGIPNPPWAEWLMGFPIGWTGLKPLETARFREWFDMFGKNCVSRGLTGPQIESSPPPPAS